MIQLALFQGEIRALSGQKPGASMELIIPTCPDTSLPWSASVGPNGFSAKMFLHQTLQTLRPRWTCSDTEALLSRQMPIRIQAKTEPEKLLSDVLKKPSSANSSSYISDKAARGLIRRNIIRRRAILVLLRTDADTMRVMVTFGTEGRDYGLQIKTKEKRLPAFLLDGLTDYLRQRLHELQETPSSPKP